MKYLKLCNIKTYFWYLNLNPILVNGVCELFVQIIQVEPNKLWGKDSRIFPNGQTWFKRQTLDAFLTLIHNRINFVCISLNKFGMRCRMQTDTILCTLEPSLLFYWPVSVLHNDHFAWIIMSGFESISECLCEIEEVGNTFADQRRLHCSQVSNHAVLEKLTNKLPVKRLRFSVCSVRSGQGAEGVNHQQISCHYASQ